MDVTEFVNMASSSTGSLLEGSFVPCHFNVSKINLPLVNWIFRSYFPTVFRFGQQREHLMESRAEGAVFAPSQQEWDDDDQDSVPGLEPLVGVRVFVHVLDEKIVYVKNNEKRQSHADQDHEHVSHHEQ